LGVGARQPPAAVTDWAEPAIAGVESVIGLMFQPTRLLASTFASALLREA
jgi:hypothetical protein